MKIKIELTEHDLKRIIANEILQKLGDLNKFNEANIKILVKSKQNYKSEWEIANFKAEYEGDDI